MGATKKIKNVRVYHLSEKCVFAKSKSEPSLEDVLNLAYEKGFQLVNTFKARPDATSFVLYRFGLDEKVEKEVVPEVVQEIAKEETKPE